MKTFWQKIKALFTKSDVEKTSLQKTAKISILLGGIVLVCAIVYFAAIAPLLKAETNYVPELYDGEVYSNGLIYILRQYERSEIQSIEIKNENEHYKLNAYGEEDNIQLSRADSPQCRERKYSPPPERLKASLFMDTSRGLPYTVLLSL